MKTPLFVLLILCALKFSAYAQNDSTGLKTIVSKLEKQTNTLPVEKVYLHFNKPDYSIGDTIWFKAYLTIGPLHRPSALSGILYVDLINGDNKFAKSLKLKVIGGIALGQMALTETLLPGNYRIRAYTNWMRNMDAGYFFEKNIIIGNPKYNAVFVNSTYKVNAGQVNARLVYSDKFGRPYANKLVNYTIKADTATVYKSTGTTDAHGVLNVSFPAQAKNNQKANHITTSIKLFNSVVVDKSIPLSVFDGAFDLQFFPEGGQWLNGVRSKVGFKATGVNGLGVDVKGVVIDNDNNVVAYISSKHLGMGYFAMMPQSGKTYKAKITLPDSSETTIKLPDAADKGYVLAVDNRDSVNLQVRVSTNTTTFQEKQNTLFLLVGQSAGVVYYTTAQKLDNPVFTATIPKSKFPTGIVQFTLFSATLEPLNERVVFVQNNDLLNLNLTANKPVFGPREQVDLNLSAKDANSKPVIGSFSLTVFNDDETQADNEHTILSNLLLTSDLKGYIEQPNYYFEPINNQTQADLDVLMLTQGYRRFSWPAVIAGPEPLIVYKPEKFTDISGTLTTPSGKPVSKGKVSILSVIDGVSIDTLTDAQGKFIFPDIEFPDSTKLMVQARKANDGANVNIFLNSHTAPIILKNTNIGDESLSMQAPILKDTLLAADNKTPLASDSIQLMTHPQQTKALNEVDIKAKRSAPATVLNNYGTALQYKVKMEQIKDETSIYDALRSRIPGVSYKNGGLYYDGKRLAVMVNGVSFRQNYLQFLEPRDVESVSIVGTLPPIAMVISKAYAGTDTIKMKEVTIQSNKSKKNGNAPWMPEVTHSSNLNGAGNANQVLAGTAFDECSHVYDCFLSKINGITPKGTAFVNNRNGKAIHFFVDGVDMGTNVSTLDAIRASEVETVEVLLSNAYLSIYGIGGAIQFNLKQGAGATAIDTVKLQQVDIKSHRNAKTNKNGNAPWVMELTNSANLNGPGNADQVIPGKAFEECGSLVDCFIAKITGISRRTINGVDGFYSNHQLEINFGKNIQPISLYLDGINLGSDPTAFDGVNVHDVESVEVLLSGNYLATYGFASGAGVILVNLRKGHSDNDSYGYASVPGVIYTTFKGFNKPRQFYIPKYDVSKTNDQIFDSRTAVYWNPYVITEVNGASKVQFYNSDVKGSYRVVVEGIDNTGNIGRYVYRYKVE